MRIALIARGCRPGAGIPLYTYELARRLSLRHEVDVLTDPREAQSCGARLVPIRVPAKPLWHNILHFSTRAGYLAHARAYDVVHTQGSDATWGDVVTAHSCHRAGMRASLHQEPGWVNHLRKLLSPAHQAILSLERGTYTSARYLLTVSERVRRQVLATYPALARAEMQVVYPGVARDEAAWGERDRLRQTQRQRLGLTDNDLLFVLVANAPKLKGAERLIRGLAASRQERLHVLITTPVREEAYWRRLARRSGVAGQVHCATAGPSPAAWYAAGDVHASLPEYEAFGLAVLEAMAWGLPVLLTRNAGLAEQLVHEREGLLLPSRIDEHDLALAMRRLADDPALRRRCADHALETAHRFSWDQTVDAVEKIYTRAARRRMP